jgi:hypothetical protein
MTERARYWSGQVAAWEQSGLSQAAFCRRERIHAGTFAWWKRRLQKAGGKSLSSGRGRVRGKRPTRREQWVEARTSRPAGSRSPTDGSVRARRGRPAKASGRFVEVRLAGTPSRSAYEVVLAGGRSVRVPSQFDPQVLSRLITAVESC